MPKLPSRTIRIEPNCSPPFVAHQVDCPAVALLLQVAELLKPTGKAKP